MILGIYGTGGSGKELLEMVERFDELKNRWHEVVFIDDTREIGEFRGRRMMPLEEFSARFARDAAEIVIAVGEPYYRLRMAEKVSQAGFDLATIVHPMAHVSPSASLGKGVVVRLGSVVSADARVEDNVWIQTYVTIGHDVIVGANTQISSYVMLAGAVHVGRNVFIGIHAAVREEQEIGDDAIISMGAMVMSPVRAREVVAGSPATVMMMNESRRVFKSARHQANAITHKLVQSEIGESARDAVKQASPETVARVSRLLLAKLPGLDFSRSPTMADDGLIDSMSMARIVESIKAEFGIEIPYRRITPSRFNSLEALAALVEECMEPAAEPEGTFAASFRVQAMARPDAFCLGCGEERLTYANVLARVCACQEVLRDRYGVVAGDRVMISGVARPDYVVGLLAAQGLGAVTVPFDRRIKTEMLASFVSYVRPKVLLAGDESMLPGVTCAALAEITRSKAAQPVLQLAAAKDEDVAEMLFTTGTTGMPKGTMLSNRAVRAIVRHTRDGVGMRQSDVVLIPIPLNHSVGMRVLRTALSMGAGVVLQDGLAFAQVTERNLTRFGCTAMTCVPTAADLLRDQMGAHFAEVFGRLRYLEFGAGSVSVPMKQALIRELPGVRLINTWGSSETGGAIFLEFSAHPDKLDTLGRPVAEIAISMLDDKGAFVVAHDAKSAGRLALRGEMCMSGYYERPEESAAALRGEWLVTNDLAWMDDDGFVHMLGRADDIINVGGEKVAPVEVERVAQDWPDVRECGCVGIPDPLLGEVPVLFYVSAKSEFDEVAYLRHLEECLERYQMPARVYKVEGLPRNSMAKLNRQALKSMIPRS